MDSLRSWWSGPALEGHHKKVFPNGDVYAGEFIANVRQGSGCYVTTLGHRYEGGWYADKRHGVGKQSFVVKKKKGIQWAGSYEGEWKEGLKEGKGTFEYANNDRYVGEWLGGQKCGMGRYYYHNGDMYDGQFANNKMHGQGIMLFGDTQDQLIGEWEDDDLNGRVIRICTSGDKYAEEYSSGQLTQSNKLKHDSELVLRHNKDTATQIDTLNKRQMGKQEKKKEEMNQKVGDMYGDDML